MKPDLKATTFSPQNAFYFSMLSKIAYKPKNEARGIVQGNSTSAGLGFDRFHWFEVSSVRHSLFDDRPRNALIPALNTGGLGSALTASSVLCMYS